MSPYILFPIIVALGISGYKISSFLARQGGHKADVFVVFVGLFWFLSFLLAGISRIEVFTLCFIFSYPVALGTIVYHLVHKGNGKKVS